MYSHITSTIFLNLIPAYSWKPHIDIDMNKGHNANAYKSITISWLWFAISYWKS